MKKPKIHLICNAHIDPVWQWQWEEGCSESIATFRNAVQIINEHKDFIFTHNEALLYQWVKRYDPILFKEIKKLVAKGRWCIGGAWYLQPDVNMPGTEAIIRQITEGRKFFSQEFGVEPVVAYNFDSFGHSSGLPQILKLTGYKMYVHMRPLRNELPLPSDLYIWKGVDGSEIISYRPFIGHYNSLREGPNSVEDRLIENIKYVKEINRDVAQFWGLGNHGGGATRKDLEIIDQIIRSTEDVEILHSTPDYFYESIKKESGNFPIVQTEIQRTNTGCYISFARNKRRMQKSLGELVQTEALCAASWWLFGQKYPHDEINECWNNHLFNDFHDILPGSSTESVEKDVMDLYGKIAVTLQRERLNTAISFNNRMKPHECYIPVTILNANPALKKVPVELECMIDYVPLKKKGYLKVSTLDGTEILSQEEPPECYLMNDVWRRKVCFLADLPSLGSANFKIEFVEGERNIAHPKPYIDHEIDIYNGLIKSLKTKDGDECLKDQLFKPLIIEDKGDSWGTDVLNYRKIRGNFQPSGYPKTIVDGPVRTITESRFTSNHSKIYLQTISYSEFPILEFRFRIHWNEEKKRLKLSIPTLLNDAKLVCEIPGGIIERPADADEYVQNRWSIISGNSEGKDIAIGIINTGQYSVDFKDGELRLSIVRSAAYCHGKDFDLSSHQYVKYMDIGVHEVKLFVTVGDYDTIVKYATAFSDFISAKPVSFPHLPIGLFKNEKNIDEQEHTLLDIDEPNIRLMACYKAKDKKSLIIRLQEVSGKETKTKMSLNSPKKKINMSFKPYEIKTIKFGKDGNCKQVDIIGEE